MTVIRYYIIVQLLLLLNYSSASYVALPNINFDPLQQLGITGSLGGISIYKDTNQLTQIPAYTSSVLSYTNDTFQLIGATETNHSIYTICSMGTTTFIGGNFTTLNGVTVNNIAMYDTSNPVIRPLQMGLDGPVYTMYCDTDTLYVGGAFLAPVASNDVQRTASLAQFGGGMAMYKNNQWQGLPWKGVNGPVKSIVKKDPLLLFGGSFDTTTDLQISRAPASQPITLISAVAAVNSSTTYSDPSTVLCASANSTTPWTLADGKIGTWQATFDYFITPTLIRLANSNLDNYKTKGFAIRPLTASTATSPYFNLSFVDPVTGQRNTCSNNCTLTNTNDYQDFIVTDTDISAGGIAIDIVSWYGNGGGLSSVEMYQSEIFVYAVDTMTNQTCKAVSKVSTSGTWSRVSGSASYEAYLSTTLTTSNKAATLTFSPSLTESGFYQVLLYSPACTDCVDIDVTIQNGGGGGGATNVVTVSQVNTAATSQAIYTGYFDISKTQPTIKIGIAHNATVTSTKNTILVNSIQFIQQATADNLTSILQYDTSVTNVTSVPWGPLTGDNLPYNSKDVYTMTILNNQLYIGGKFRSTDITGANYTNIVSYDTTTHTLKALGQTGPNGPIYTMTSMKTGDLFVGGNFSSLTTVTNQMSNVARYDINQQTWNSLNGGVNGTVYGVFPIDDTTLLISGDFTQLSIGNATSQNGWWDTTTHQWLTTTPYLSGIIYAYNNGLYGGAIQSAQQYQTNGFLTINHNGTLNNNHFYPSNKDASVSTGILYNVGQTSTMVLAGQFSLSNQIQNLAIYSNETWSSFHDVVIQGQVMAMLIHEDALYVGGQFTNDGLSNLAVFDLKNKSLSANPSVQVTGASTMASVNVIRYISSQNSIVMGGQFTQVGTLSCTSVCSLNLETLQWNALGTGLSGQVYDINEINGDLVVTGDLTLNNNPLKIAQYDYKKNTWGPFSTADLPGPSQYMMYDSVKNALYITGKVNDTTYLRIWDGQQFNSPSTDLGVGSTINQLSLLPLTDNQDSILLASGFLNLGDKNVSAAFYDGTHWIPYLVTSSGYQSDKTLSGLFYLSQPQIVTVINHYLSTGIVILISIAISLGIVFLIVFCAMGCLFMKRKRDAKVNPESNPSAYYGKPPQDPQQLLMSLQKADPGLNDRYSMEDEKQRRNTLEPGDQLYNMSKSISTEHLHDPPVSQSHFNMGAAAVGAAAMMGISNKSHEMIPQQQQFRSMPNSNNNNNNNNINNNGNYHAMTTTNGMGTFGTARPESFARPVSEIHRDSFANSINYDASPMPTSREMTELNNRNSYNPFRSSTAGIGMAIGAGVGAVTAMNNNANQNNNNNNNNNATYDFLSNPPTSQQVTYSNIAPPPPQHQPMVTSNQPDTVRWTQAPPEVTSQAVVQPVSMLKDDKQLQNVRWTTANSDNAKAQAMIAPVISTEEEEDEDDDDQRHHQENNNDALPVVHHNLQNLSSSTLTVAQPENIRWTNFSTTGAMGTLTVEPGRESVYSDFYSASDVTHDIPLPVPVAVAEQQTNKKKNVQEEQEKGSTLSADPDIVRWTTAPASNVAKAHIEHLDRGSYQPSLTNDTKLVQDDDRRGSINAKVMHPNAFRLSDAGSLVSKPSNNNFKSDLRVSRFDIDSDDDDEGTSKEVRWKTANVASPIETGEPPKLMEPASVMITSRGQTPEEEEERATSPFDSYFNNIMALNKNAKNETGKKEEQQSNFLSENYTEKSKSIDDLIASRDLAGLSYILNEAEEHPQPTTLLHTPEEDTATVGELQPLPSSSTPMDGRAASKRMVQEYLLNKKTDRSDKRAKYKSSFKQLMTTAIENNQQTKFATEDAPHLYYAKFDFSASEQDELGFGKGDAIIVIDSSDDIWWTGYKTNGDDGFIRGVFPSNYVEMATSLNI